MTDNELIQLAKEYLTDYIHECECKTEQEVRHAIKAMLVVAASVTEVNMTCDDED
jgi:hypothetical protein